MPEIIIIGAGMSGISAAAELGTADYLVLEARDRVGGRIYSSPLGPVDLGAAWLHQVPDNVLLEVADANGIKSTFDDEKVAVYGPSGPLDMTVLGPALDKFNSWRNSNPAEQLPNAVEQFLKVTDGASAAQLKDFNAFQQLPLGLPYGKISSHYSGPQGRDKAIVGGYGQILSAIQKKVDSSKIKSGVEVKELIDNGNEVKVVTSSGDYTAKRVIVTLPVGVLKDGNVKFQPPLSPVLEQALKTTSTAAIGKVYLEFDSVFWPTETEKFIITGDAPALVYNWYSVHGKIRKILGVLVSNDAIRKVEAHPKNAFELVKPYLELIKLPKSVVAQPTAVVTSNWVSDPYCSGHF